MANTAASLNLVSLDYDQIANSLSQFIQAQPEFQGYDLAAGAMASIIKLLAYNAWQTAFFTNMAISESFLDTAQLQQSVFSHAKELNYVPRSAASASAQVQMTWTAPSPVYTIPKGSQFAALVRGTGSLLFSVPENVTVIAQSNNFCSTNLIIYEGTYVADAYVMNYSDPDQRFFITNQNVDTSSITLAVTDTSSLTANVYTQANTLLGLTGTNHVWFLQAAETGQYEVLFGDGVVGFKPTDGATVVIDYRITKGSEGNGAKVFTTTFNPNPGDAVGINVTTISTSSSGLDAETVDSVRFFAPRYFQIQQRAVTSSDYAIMLRDAFPEIADAYAYGGETLTPPQYNKVFVSVQVSGVDSLPDSKIQQYTAFLQARVPLTTVPVIVSPTDMFLSISSNVSYDTTVTTLTPSDIQSEVILAMQNYANTNLGTFNSTIHFSRFLAAIDASDVSIISNQTNYHLYQLISPIKGGVPQNFTVNFNVPLGVDPNPAASTANPIVEEYNVWTGRFILNGQSIFIADDGEGNLRLVLSLAGTQVYGATVGSVDYATGLVQLANFAPADYDGSTLKVYADTASEDIHSPINTVITIGDEVVVNVQGN